MQAITWADIVKWSSEATSALEAQLLEADISSLENVHDTLVRQLDSLADQHDSLEQQLERVGKQLDDTKVSIQSLGVLRRNMRNKLRDLSETAP